MGNEILPKLTSDRSGVLEVALRESRNVVPPEEQVEDAERPVRYIVSIKPATVVVDEGSGSEYEFTVSPGAPRGDRVS